MLEKNSKPTTWARWQCISKVHLQFLSLHELIFSDPNNSRVGSLIFEDQKYTITVADLPTVVETHKTPDNKSYYKSGDIGQVLIVQGDEPFPLAKTSTSSDGSVAVVDGLTPPAKNIRKRKFRSIPHVSVSSSFLYFSFIFNRKKKSKKDKTKFSNSQEEVFMILKLNRSMLISLMRFMKPPI